MEGLKAVLTTTGQDIQTRLTAAIAAAGASVKSLSQGFTEVGQIIRSALDRDLAQIEATGRTRGAIAARTAELSRPL